MRLVDFFCGLFLYVFQNPKDLKKKPVLSKLPEITVYIASLGYPTSKDSLLKMRLGVFLHMLFLENEAKIKENNYRMMFFMSKQVSVPKISLILQEVKVSPKSDICPFCMKAFKSQCKLTKCPCYSFPFYLILEVVARLYNLKLYLDCNSIGKYNLMIQVDKC